jgi:hypothetical protein
LMLEADRNMKTHPAPVESEALMAVTLFL